MIELSALKTYLENLSDISEECGWPRKLDNLTWCKKPVKLT